MSGSSSDEEEVPLAVPLNTTVTQQISSADAANQSTAEMPPGGPPAAAPVPITLITGYLGAGKTTLVNQILSTKHGFRCAVLLNEIADSADIERALVKEPEGAEASPLAEWTELENGCICCSAKNDMVKALEALMQQRSRFDYVLIETTGLANPGPVAAALWTDEQLESSICLDCIVAVVDARHIERQLADPRPAGAVNEAQQQVAFADVVLLNKVDLADEEQLQRIEGAVRSINAEASVVRCHRCEIDLGRILNTGIYSAAGRAAEAVPVADARSPPTGARGTHAEQQGQHSCDDPGCSDPHHHHHSDSSGQHDGRVGTVTVLLPPGRAVDLPRLRRWLDELLWEQDGGRDGAAADDSTAGRAAAVPEIFRIKGLLHVAGSDSKHVLQGVHEIYDVVEGPHWAPGEQRCCKLVFIGRQLNREALQQGVESCLAS